MRFAGPSLTRHSYKLDVFLSTKRPASRGTDSLGRGRGRSPDRAGRPVLSSGPVDPASPHTPPGCSGGLRRAGEGAGESTHVGSLGRLHRHGAGRREGAAAWERNTGEERASSAARRSPQRRTRMLSQPAPRRKRPPAALYAPPRTGGGGGST